MAGTPTAADFRPSTIGCAILMASLIECQSAGDRANPAIARLPEEPVIWGAILTAAAPINREQSAWSAASAPTTVVTIYPAVAGTLTREGLAAPLVPAH